MQSRQPNVLSAYVASASTSLPTKLSGRTSCEPAFRLGKQPQIVAEWRHVHPPIRGAGKSGGRLSRPPRRYGRGPRQEAKRSNSGPPLSGNRAGPAVQLNAFRPLFLAPTNLRKLAIPRSNPGTPPTDHKRSLGHLPRRIASLRLLTFATSHRERPADPLINKLFRSRRQLRQYYGSTTLFRHPSSTF